MKSHAFSVTKMRPKRSALSSGPGPSLFHDGSSLLPFRTWEERQQHNLPIFTRRLKTSPIRRCSAMFCSTTKSGKKRKTQKKLPIGSFNPVLQSHPKAKPKKAAELRPKWALSLHKVSWISLPHRSGKKTCAG